MNAENGLAAAALLAVMFALTALIEGAAVGIWFRSRRYVYYSLLCNLLTNPALNVLLALAVRAWGAAAYAPVLAALETAVLFIEAYVWRLLAPFSWRKALAASLVTNAASFGLGLLLSNLITQILRAAGL